MKLLIIGGVAGGATAAARARRLNEQAQIILFERGEHISFANCGLPYYIGGVITKREHLFVTTVRDFTERYNIDIRIFSEVTRIDRVKKEVEVKNSQTGEIYKENYDKIILAPGAEPVRPPIPGIDLPGIFSLRNVPDSDRKRYVPFCAAVLRSYIGHRILIQHGFRSISLADGFRIFKGVSEKIEALTKTTFGSQQ